VPAPRAHRCTLPTGIAVAAVVSSLLAGCSSSPRPASTHATSAPVTTAGGSTTATGGTVPSPAGLPGGAGAEESVPAPASGSPGAYRRYTNPRYGFTCQVPADFTAGEEPANGDGLAFTGAPGVQVSCSGANNAGDETPQQGMDDVLAAAASEGRTVTYQHLAGDTITVSGTGPGGDVFYVHTIWGTGSNVTVAWSYPAAAKQQLDAAVVRSARTLEPGDLTTAH
jgi:hypothetical protein